MHKPTTVILFCVQVEKHPVIADFKLPCFKYKLTKSS